MKGRSSHLAAFVCSIVMLDPESISIVTRLPLTVTSKECQECLVLLIFTLLDTWRVFTAGSVVGLSVATVLTIDFWQTFANCSTLPQERQLTR